MAPRTVFYQWNFIALVLVVPSDWLKMHSSSKQSVLSEERLFFFLPVKKNKYCWCQRSPSFDRFKKKNKAEGWMKVLGRLFNLTFCQLDILSAWHFVNLAFGQLDICSTWHLVYLTFCQLDILSTSHFVNLTFCQLHILSTWHFVNLKFCQVYILSS
jgi:hypothetical protein